MKSFASLAFALLAVVFTTTAAQLNPKPAGLTSTEELVGYDKRRDSLTNPSAEQKKAHDDLGKRVRGAKVDFDPLLGSPKWIHSTDEHLTGPRGEGKGVDAKTAAKFRNDPDAPVKAFVEEHRTLFGHGAEALGAAAKTRDYVTEHNGVHTVAWQQRLENIPVYESVFAAHTTRNGELINVSSQFVPDVERAANRGTPNRAAHLRGPKISAQRALEIAASTIREPAESFTVLDEKPQGAEQLQNFKIKPLPGDASARLVWFPITRDELRLCWQTELNRRQQSERFRVIVDVQNGDVHLWRKLTVEIGAVTYRVFTNDSPTPMRPGWPTPNATQPPLVQQALVTVGALSTNASPLGWINDGETILRGNNVDAQLDRDADNRADLPRVTAAVDGSGARYFTNTVNPLLHPTNYSRAAAVQLFYWCNWMHDRLYDIGFTEAKGNFQKDNFGRGGQGNDAIIADAQDGSGFNNANYTPAGDGVPGRIQMYLFNGPNPMHDGDLDAEVILHEYTHGLSDRRVGHGVGISQWQTLGMGEGWSDFFAETMLTKFEHPLDANYPMGGYASYMLSGLKESYYYGIRRYPYTTDTNVSPLVFSDIDPNQARAYVGIPRSPIAGGTGAEVHRQGEVWCLMLWEMRAALLRAMSPTAETYAATNDFIMRLVADAMDLGPANPSFVQARDAILAAERLSSSGGFFRNVMWQAFAKRGLGFSAVAPDVSTTIGVVAAYDVPVRPPIEVTPSELVFNGSAHGTNFLPRTGVFTIQNPNNFPITYSVSSTVPLSITPTNETIAAFSTRYVTVQTNGFESLPAGQTTITVTFTSDSYATSRSVVVNAAAVADALDVEPTTTFQITGPPGGPFTPDSRIYTLQCNAPVNWTATNIPPWLTLSQTNGALDVGQFINVTASVNFNANTLAAGTYNVALAFMNTATGHREETPVSLRVGSQDYLTEIFNAGQFDLQFTSLTLVTNATGYAACASPAGSFPTDPTPGQTLNLGDDEYQMVTLEAGHAVKLFGVSTNVLWIGANGNVTPDPGANTNFFYVGLGEYFARVRVAPLYTDLFPPQQGRVSWLELSNRVVVTWENITEFGLTNSNNFQVELFYDGIIRITWLHVDSPQTGALGVIAGVSRGAGQPVDFSPSDLSSEQGCAPTARLVAPSTAREGDPPTQGTVILSGPALSNIVVQLVCDKPGELLVPEFVTIPQNTTRVDFPISILDDSLLDGTQVATITATFPDRPAASASVAVDDNESTRITIAVPTQATEGAGVLSGEGFILLGATAGRDVAVKLASSNTSRVLVPPTVIVPAGSRTASFDVTVLEDAFINGPLEDIIVSASVNGWQLDRDVISVADNESYQLAISLVPQISEVVPSVAQAGWVSLSAPTLVPWTISLGSDQAQTVFPLEPVYISAGAQSNYFSLGITPNIFVNPFDVVYIRAFAPGFLSATGSVVLIDDERPTEPFGPTPTNGATRVPADVTLFWQVDPPATNGSIFFDVYLGANASALALLGSTTNSYFALSNVIVLDSGGNYFWQVIARRDAYTKPGAVWRFSTSPFDHFNIDPVPSPQIVGEPFSVRVTARDSGNVLIQNFTGTATLTNTVPGRSSSRIVITEVDNGSFNRVEFQNAGDRNVDISGWEVSLYDTTTWPSPKTIFTIPGPSICKTGEVFQVRNFTPLLAPGRYPNFNLFTNVIWNANPSNNQCAVMLRDTFGNVVDFFCAGDAFPAQISVPITVPALAWNGATASPNLNFQRTYQRIGNLDHDNGGDWTNGIGSMMTNNVALSVPFTNYFAARMIATPLTNWVGGAATSSVVVLDEAKQMLLGVTDSFGHGGTGNRFDVFARNDLSLTINVPESVLVLDQFRCQFVVTNSGPSNATGVMLTNSLPLHAANPIALATNGSCTPVGDVIVCDLGDIASGATKVVDVYMVLTSPGFATNSATVGRSDVDGYAANNSASAFTLAMLPQVTINDLTNAEPFTSTPATFTFNVRLSPASAATCSVQFATSDGTATAGVDYVGTNGTIVFPPGVTNVQVGVVVMPDSLSESNETFFVNLSGALNAQVTRTFGVGTIQDTDGVVSLSVADTTAIEGGVATFAISLSTNSGKNVSVSYATVDGNAVAGTDYEPVYGFLAFPPGVTNLFVTTTVRNDSVYKPNRSFSLSLSSPNGAVLSKGTAACSILDDDTNLLHHLAFDLVPSKAYVKVPFTVVGTARDAANSVFTNFTGPVHLLATENETPLSLGTNKIPWEFPLGSGFHDSRLQVIYQAAELGAAGQVTSLALDVTNAPGLTLSNFTIRTKPFVPAQFPNTAWEAGGWMTNFQADVTITSTGWVAFAFRAPYVFDGTTNVLVDFSFNNSAYGSEGLCRASTVSGLRSMGFRSDSAYGDPLLWTNALGSNPPPWTNATPAPAMFNRIPNTRFTIGRAVVVTPDTTTSITNGFFTAEVTLNSAASNLTFRAVDDAGHSVIYSGWPVVLDGDGDGMPDWWEIAHGFDRNDPSDASLDADEDGLTNLQEFIAGTDPRAASSTVRITSVARTTNSIRITVQSVPGKEYALEFAVSLPGSWQTSTSARADSASLDLFDRPPTNSPVRFYRVQILP